MRDYCWALRLCSLSVSPPNKVVQVIWLQCWLVYNLYTCLTAHFLLFLDLWQVQGHHSWWKRWSQLWKWVSFHLCSHRSNLIKGLELYSGLIWSLHRNIQTFLKYQSLCRNQCIPLDVHNFTRFIHKPLIALSVTLQTVSSSLSFFKLGGVDSSVIWGYLRVQARIVFPLGASVLSLILTITSQAFAGLVLVHRGWRSKLWACNKLTGRAPALRSALSLYSVAHN